jgi:5-dehydro-2-deoxygluconokinase
MNRPLDLICVGRAAVDLYGEQIGGRLEDMQSFTKYLGGSPANTAVGVARLGLKPAMLTRVGDEHNGRFVRETLAAEGVDVSHVATDPKRLTALVFLGIQDRDTFPLVFYRDNCADMAISPDDFDAAFIASSKALLISGTHLSQPLTYESCTRAMALAKAAGTRVVLDIDYRPVLWGLTSPAWASSALCLRAKSARTCRPSSASATWWSAPKKKSTSPAAAPTRWPPCAACAN